MSSPEVYTVRLLIFSGRPDPEWALDGDAVGDLMGRLRETLAGEESNPPPPSVLGYRGFLVRARSADRSLPTEFRVFRGVITAEDGRRGRHMRDAAGLEEFLLEDARRRGYGDVLDESGVGIKGRTPGGPTAQA